jgi:hypothetical protein
VKGFTPVRGWFAQERLVPATRKRAATDPGLAAIDFAALCCEVASMPFRPQERRFVMSRFVLAVALILSSVGLKASPALTGAEGGHGNHAVQTAGSVSARAAMDELITYGAYGTQAAAHAKGEYEINVNGADAYGAGYCESDPDGGDRGPGYYVTVHYP